MNRFINILLFVLFSVGVFAQDIEYGMTRKTYEIAGIEVEGADSYEDFVLIGFSGLAVGDKIEVPGDQITKAIKRFWKQGLFSNVKIKASKFEGNKVWLVIQLEQRPRISEVRYEGLKKSEREDVEVKAGIRQGSQMTPNLEDHCKTVIKKYLVKKVAYTGKDDPEEMGAVFLEKGARNVIIKLGGKGCFFKNRDEELLLPAYGIDAVDVLFPCDFVCKGKQRVWLQLVPRLEAHRIRPLGHLVLTRDERIAFVRLRRKRLDGTVKAGGMVVRLCDHDPKRWPSLLRCRKASLHVKIEWSQAMSCPQPFVVARVLVGRQRHVSPRPTQFGQLMTAYSQVARTRLNPQELSMHRKVPEFRRYTHRKANSSPKSTSRR